MVGFKIWKFFSNKRKQKKFGVFFCKVLSRFDSISIRFGLIQSGFKLDNYFNPKKKIKSIQGFFPDFTSLLFFYIKKNYITKVHLLSHNLSIFWVLSISFNLDDDVDKIFFIILILIIIIGETKKNMFPCFSFS